jgi:hypothetical protein
MDPRRKSAVHFSHEAFSGLALSSGQQATPSWHRFSTTTFPSQAKAQDYIAETGLQNTGHQQNWGGGASGPIYRSRRGSVAGFVAEPVTGEVRAWRWSSHATTSAIRAQEIGLDPQRVYDRTALAVMGHARNSRGRQISPNAVLSDAGQVHFNSVQRSFELLSPSFAQGISGAGMDRRSIDPNTLYEKGKQAAVVRGSAGTDAQVRHSEPAALFLHDQVRTTPLSATPNATLMVTSIPNQVCRNCMHTFQDSLAKGSFVSGMPGLPFGGQQPGVVNSPDKGVSVARAVPLIGIFRTAENQREVAAVIGRHARPAVVVAPPMNSHKRPRSW